jgi:hypothetical protein
MPKSKLSWLWAIVKVTVICAALIVVLAGIGYRITGLQGKASVVAGNAPKPKVDTEDKQLFFDLLRAKLLVRRDDGGLDMKSSDYLLRVRAGLEKPIKGTKLSEQASLLGDLYTTSVGVIVRQQVRLWNATRRIAAVRDDRTVAEDDKDKQLWRAYTATSHPLGTGNLVSEAFGFIHDGVLSAGYQEWVTVASERETIVFKTKVKAGNRGTLHVQVVGDPVNVPAGARVSRKKLEPYLTKTFWPCEIASQAAIITIPGGSIPRNGIISISVKPAVNCDPVAYGLAISMSVKDREKMADRLDAHKRALRRWKRSRKADKGDAPKAPTVEWAYNWRPVARSRKTSARRFAIKTADGVYLTDPDGRGTPTDQTHKLGLLSLIGFGPSDAASLIGIIGKSALPTDRTEIALTIDSKLQRITQETVSHYFGKVFPKMSGNRFADERRGAVVLLDPDTGEILALGGWPQPPKNATGWDYVSFAKSNPLRDPMSIMAWEVIDKHNTPGSTMKPLLSLGVMGAKRPRLNEIMIGLTPGEVAARMGLNPGSGTYTIPGSSKSISNFGNSPLSRYFNSTNRARDCVPDGAEISTANRFGVPQAVQFSINMWFARLAVMLEEADVEKFMVDLRAKKKAGNAPKILTTLPATNLIQALRRIGIDDRKGMDLTVNVPDNLGLYRLLGADQSRLPASDRPERHRPSLVRQHPAHGTRRRFDRVG